MTEFCKRLFPGSAAGKRGEALAAPPAHCGRPQLADDALSARGAAAGCGPLAARSRMRAYALRREAARRMPERVSPGSSVLRARSMPFQQEEGFLLRTDSPLADEMGLGKPCRRWPWSRS